MNVKPAIDDLRSHHLRPAAMPWQKTRFAGCEFKPLMVDPTSGLATLLFRMAPGAVLPDHEHVLIEQTYMIEGRLVDKEGPEAGLAVGPGDFVWRPAGSRHSAWTPEGGLMLAVFQVPNKFFEQSGKIVDMIGQEWDLAWKHALPNEHRRSKTTAA
jgi:anti-sigma factor ChrR (cupin superfamily)